MSSVFFVFLLLKQRCLPYLVLVYRTWYHVRYRTGTVVNETKKTISSSLPHPNPRPPAQRFTFYTSYYHFIEQREVMYSIGSIYTSIRIFSILNIRYSRNCTVIQIVFQDYPRVELWPPATFRLLFARTQPTGTMSYP